MSFTLGSFDLFIESAPKFGFFDIDHLTHGPRDRELWVMGWHVVVSRRC